MNKTPVSARLRPPLLIGIILAQALFMVWFLYLPLPSVGSALIRRASLLLAADDHLSAGLSNLRHVENLPERVPILLASLLIATASLGVGTMLLRWMGCVAGASLAERIALGFGFGAAILGVATLLLGRWLGLNPVAVRAALTGLVLAGVGSELWARRRDRVAGDDLPRWSVGQILGFVAIAGPFMVLMALGAMLPTIEFDALEYHLQGPKEYFLNGRISFLGHNVYTSMPAGVEMLTTLAMEVMGDWWLGGLAGQELIAWFAVATAVLIATTATRISGSTWAGWFAALIYLTTPWIFRVGNTPFVEGPLCFFHAALIWTFIRFDWRLLAGSVHGSPGLLVGMLAGAAFGIKYPALISAVIPAGCTVLVLAIRQRSSRLVLDFMIGLGLMVVPWLGKNLADTGNPVYPLAWSVFGGSEWDADRAARWQTAHGPRPVRLDLLAGSILDLAGRSDWQSPLFATLVPLAWIGKRSRRVAAGLALYAAYLFLTWWLLTHRLDRFWLPILPALAVLAGLGATSFGRASSGTAGWLGLVLVVGIGTNFTLCATELCGPTAWTAPLAAVRLESARDGTPSLARLDEVLPANARPLVVGQAGTFGLQHPPLYSTVFNRDTFELIARGLPPRIVLNKLRRAGITHVYVDWAEIARYRQPGNYGFTDFETPEVFESLVAAGVFGPPFAIGSAQALYKVR